jgi:hypothetical protein
MLRTLSCLFREFTLGYFMFWLVGGTDGSKLCSTDPTPLNIAAMQAFAGDVSKKGQDAIVDWANTTFWGYQDHMNHTIL